MAAPCVKRRETRNHLTVKLVKEEKKKNITGVSLLFFSFVKVWFVSDQKEMGEQNGDVTLFLSNNNSREDRIEQSPQ